MSKLVKDIVQYWNSIIDENIELQDIKYTVKDIAIIITCFKYGAESNACNRILKIYGSKINLPMTSATENNIAKLI